MHLVIGNKNYSSWSLRPWLLLKANGLEFEETVIALATGQTATDIGRFNHAGKVPVLLDGELTIWDSLAICEYVSEHYLEGAGWPADSRSRARARACSAEMHSGFNALRTAMPMNCRAMGRHVGMTDALQIDITRIDQLWRELRQTSAADGDWLFGQFSIADCMYAPVVSRFQTYGVDVCTESRAYMKTLLDHPAMKIWMIQAGEEEQIIARSEVGG